MCQLQFNGFPLCQFSVIWVMATTKQASFGGSFAFFFTNRIKLKYKWIWLDSCYSIFCCMDLIHVSCVVPWCGSCYVIQIEFIEFWHECYPTTEWNEPPKTNKNLLKSVLAGCWPIFWSVHLKVKIRFCTDTLYTKA